jgi:hypothetical protein
MQNVHAHCFDQARHVSPQAVREAEIARGRPVDLTTPPDRFLEQMQAFDRVIVFGMKARHTGYWVPDQFTAEFVNRAPEQWVGFACCDPTDPRCVHDLRIAIEELGLHGVKIGHMYAGVDPMDQRCLPIYEYCQAAGLPILCHTGTTFHQNAPLGFSRPWRFDEVAIAFPDLTMVLAHVGHPFSSECLVVIRKHPHLLADISALHYRPWQFYQMLIMAQEYRVTDKLLFGTDYPFAETLETIEGLQKANRIIAQSGLPPVRQQTIDDILQRDSFARLGLAS